MRKLVPVAIAVLVVAGCGGDDDGDGETSALATESTAGGADAASAADPARVAKLIRIARQPQAGKSQKESIRIAEAQGELLVIAEEDPEAIAPLTVALEKPDYQLITDLHGFFIQLGRPGSEKVLVEALNSHGFTPEGTMLALAYLSSGHKPLIRGAREWASRNGATITGSPSGVVGPRWGSTGLPAPEIPQAPPPSP